MASFTEQMQDLAAEILKSHEERRAWLAAFRQEVNAFGEQAESMCRERRAWVGSLRDEVRQMRRELTADREGAQQAWQKTAGLVAAQRRARRPARAESKARHRE